MVLPFPAKIGYEKSKKMLTFYSQGHILLLQAQVALYTRLAEFTFKRHVMSSATGPPTGGFFYARKVLYEPIHILG